MKTIVVTEPNKIEMIEVPKPKPGPYQALARTKIASLCNSTDRMLIEGRFPGHDKYPLALGHECVAVIEEIGSKVQYLKVGDHVIGGTVDDFGDENLHSGWGGFSEYVLVHDHDAMVFSGLADAEHGWNESSEIQAVVNKEIPFEEAIMLCTWRKVYAGIGDFQLKAGNDILIFGGGPVGLSFTLFARLLGMGWIGVVEPDPGRHARFKTMGATEVLLPENVSMLKGRKFLDAAVDTVGDAGIVNLALPLLKKGASMCIYDVLTENIVSFDQSLGPRNFNLLLCQWPTRYRERAAQEPLCRWIREGKLKAEDFVTHRFPFERIREALDAVTSGEALKCLLTY